MTVEALDDDDAIADAAFTIGFAASGADYAGETESFVLTVTEDDSEELVVEPNPLEFGEGADGEITVKLASEPAGPVTVRATLSADADGNVTVNPATRRFTPSNWDQTKTFTVAGAEDADSDDDTATVTFAVDTGSYAAPDVPVAVTVDDNDDPSTKVTLTVVPTGVAENAGATTMTVTGQLDGAPRGTDTAVTVTVAGDSASASDFSAVAPFTLTIPASATSGTAQFTFEPVDDDVFEGNETVDVAGSTTVGLAVDGAQLTILEDDVRGIVLSRSAVTVTEGDTSGDTYTIRLSSEPTGTVTVEIEPPAGTDVRTDTVNYGFTPTSWATPLTVTVTAVHDDDAAADPAAAIAHSVTGGGYSGVTADDTVTVTIVEDDVPGIDVEADADPATVAEGGEIDLPRQARRPAERRQRHGDARGALRALGEPLDAHLHHRRLVDGPDGDGSRRSMTTTRSRTTPSRSASPPRGRTTPGRRRTSR